MKDRRFGKFAISAQLMEADKHTVCMALSGCVVVRCEMIYAYDNFEYTAWRSDFAQVPEGEIIPWYDVLILDYGNKIEFKKRESE